MYWTHNTKNENVFYFYYKIENHYNVSTAFGLRINKFKDIFNAIPYNIMEEAENTNETLIANERFFRIGYKSIVSTFILF